jgi:hypothetical protein
MSEPEPSQIDEVLNQAYEITDEGPSKFPGMSYEGGVIAGIEWMRGDRDEDPMED